MTNTKGHPSLRPTITQLPLPWAEAEPALPPLHDPPIIHPTDLWATLSPMVQAQVRQTIVHMLQEVLDDHAHA